MTSVSGKEDQQISPAYCQRTEGALGTAMHARPGARFCRDKRQVRYLFLSSGEQPALPSLVLRLCEAATVTFRHLTEAAAVSCRRLKG